MDVPSQPAELAIGNRSAPSTFSYKLAEVFIVEVEAKGPQFILHAQRGTSREMSSIRHMSARCFSLTPKGFYRLLLSNSSKSACMRILKVSQGSYNDLRSFTFRPWIGFF
jgi:hypothetical protein